MDSDNDHRRIRRTREKEGGRGKESKRRGNKKETLRKKGVMATGQGSL